MTGAPVSTYNLTLDLITYLVKKNITGVNSTTNPPTKVVDSGGLDITVMCADNSTTIGWSNYTVNSVLTNYSYKVPMCDKATY